ncbi:DUF3027 domain-containing protein [Dermatophilus congolensis]|uniref:Protein of uncharacterized function (DUF3027) n=1 Tax=Dermatophilus congolensis TaxID=1863 RepID=A0A239VEP3_9MICO|nr:DUF3027 domain-containing protein [Dermatophilus congolensis]MBO3128688.1 DUF3027 domain-containing protein [Dermatophilus congolensis]MBO3132675.1 DUF3027 domain-containing protein [Dermatophilus congolensis]MBO3133164.1 DUF3027 domain-containing protein [Dermatophilus congolensis]MBO3135399.1 DUF3027 domain-containing protein [Dermatophilus congolensis]MBO3137640.1 DUF3027 domain-containing protein [Dermatophilus congolensis]
MPAVKKDTTLSSPRAVEVARGVAAELAEPGTVGDLVESVTEADRLVTHKFECMAKAYRGWRWSVTLGRAPRSRKVTVCEVGLVPGADAVLSKEWVPYADRLQPGDLRPGDVLPYREDDVLVQPGFEATGDEDVDRVALWELGLGRPRVLSAEGREAAATRWYEGECGPRSEMARAAKAPCSTCGFFLPVTGALRSVFGVCASPWSPSDGRVVSLDHGCGAHSETDAAPTQAALASEPVVDDLAIEAV